MSINPTVSTHVTLDLLAWYESGLLELSPKFQRRPVWKAAAKSFFIDTMLRGFPVPPIHVRLGMGAKGAPEREIIDGQQRLRAVFDYVTGRFRLSRSLDASWAGKSFKDLTQDEQRQLMMYKFHGFQYENLDDGTVLEIFARINTYSVALSAQELRNGKYFGVFKTAMYDAARRHLEFWRQARIFTETGIARMQEVELVSELSIALLDGMQDKKNTIDEFYRNLDETWGTERVNWRRGPINRPARYLSAKKTLERLDTVTDQIVAAVGDLLPVSEFRRVPLFHSLFCAVAHRNYGLPGVDLETPLKPLGQGSIVDLRDAVVYLSELLSDKPSPEELPPWQRDFLIASSRQTDNIGPRLTRLKTIWNRANLSD
ncbi:DUF262 domain-containing protein [Kribbella sp. NPDC050241]|uniref:DUF262 domain-containing protein n=1 Tax=Kribbella sp. NPDC050241 TaxID=3364115 RepID=UPI00378F222B